MKSLLLLIFIVATAIGTSLILQPALADPVYAGVKRDTSTFATNELKAQFSQSVVTSLANMLGSSVQTTTPAPSGAKTKYELLVDSIGTVDMVDVAEVNDTFTNVQLECSNPMTANAIIEAANVISWNAIKSTGIVLASTQGPQGDTQGARTVVFFAIVTIVAVVCAGLASWCVRRRAIEKHRGINFTELAGLEEELYQRQEDNVVNSNSNNNNNNGTLNQISVPKNAVKQQSNSANVKNSSNNLNNNNNNTRSISQRGENTNSNNKGSSNNMNKNNSSGSQPRRR